MPSTDRRSASEDVLDLGERPRIPRWALLVGGLLAAVLIAGAVVALGFGGSGSSTDGSTPDESARPPSAAAGGGSAPVDSEDALILGSYLFRLTPDALYRTAASGPAGTATTLPISGLDALGPADSYHLVGDATAHLVWLVGYGSSPTTLLAVDTGTLSVRARVTLPQTVAAAAALGSDLFVVTDNAVIDVPLSGSSSGLGRLDGRYLSIAADPSRHRLLLFDVESRRAVGYDPTRNVLRLGPKLPFGKGNVLTDGSGDVWAGGYRFAAGGGAALVRLDARTLRPIGSSPLAGRLGPGAELVASGSSVVWVRSGAGGDDLWCVDGRTGRAVQHWGIDGAVTSRTGSAVVDQPGAVATLTLRGCRG
jgi:hypothetical protein